MLRVKHAALAGCVALAAGYAAFREPSETKTVPLSSLPKKPQSPVWDDKGTALLPDEIPVAVASKRARFDKLAEYQLIDSNGERRTVRGEYVWPAIEQGWKLAR